MAEPEVAATRFPPLGGAEAVCLPAPAAGAAIDADRHVTHGNRGITIVAQIDSPEAAATTELTAAVPGIDAVFIGPFDLARQRPVGRQPGYVGRHRD
jgi:2-keto-3-deoxy-L-rhamnonate aldolase RhmA